MKVIIAGGRNFRDYSLLKAKADHFLKNVKEEIQIVSGGQVSIDKHTGEMYGADYLGEQYAKERGLPLKIFPANWKLYGKSAGPIRNKQMAEYADALIAFWDGNSTGTFNMIRQAEERGLLVRKVQYISIFTP